MTDLEMTRLAAKAIGYSVRTDLDSDATLVEWMVGEVRGQEYFYPMDNHAHAFELLDTLRMCVDWDDDKATCYIFNAARDGYKADADWHTDLKRAIVECAANYQLATEKQA